MASKAYFYSELAKNTTEKLTKSRENWTEYLTTSARLYKYPFNEQVMIYAQRPDATACAALETWNTPMNRHVKRGSKGIALVYYSEGKPRLRYVFDYADTADGWLRHAPKRPFIWELKKEHEASVTDTLVKSYGETDGSLAEIIHNIASKLANDYYDNNKSAIAYGINDSFLDGYGEDYVRTSFREALTVSAAYSLMSRCGLNPDEYFTDEDFNCIFNFNTLDSVNALGTAVSDISEQVLREIEVTIKKYERTKIAERNVEDERLDVHAERGLYASQSDAEGTAGRTDREIRTVAGELPTETQQDTLQFSDSERNANVTSTGDRPKSEQAVDAINGGINGENPAPGQSNESNGLGRPHEQLESGSGRIDTERTGLRIENEPIATTYHSPLKNIAYREGDAVEGMIAHSMRFFVITKIDDDYVYCNFLHSTQEPLKTRRNVFDIYLDKEEISITEPDKTLSIENQQEGAEIETALLSLEELSWLHHDINAYLLYAIVRDETVMNAAINSDKENTMTEIENALKQYRITFNSNTLNSPTLKNKGARINETDSYFNKERKPSLKDQLYNTVINSDEYKVRLAENTPKPVFIADDNDVHNMDLSIYHDGDIIGYNAKGVEFSLMRMGEHTFITNTTKITPWGEILGADKIPADILRQIRSANGYETETDKQAGEQYDMEVGINAEHEQPGKLDGQPEYRYYSIRRPVSIGTYPRETEPKEIVNFDNKQAVEDGKFEAWGYLVYPQPLTDAQIADYELKAAIPQIQAEKNGSQIGNNLLNVEDFISLTEITAESGVSLGFVDVMLRDGGNAKDSAMRIAAHYMKGATPSENVVFLMREYGVGGKGLRIDGQRYTMRFDETGVTVAEGSTVVEAHRSVHLKWEQVESRIRELLYTGQYLPQNVLESVPAFERKELAEKLWYLHQDTNDYEFFLDDDVLSGGFPESTAKIAALAAQPEQLDKIVEGLSIYNWVYEQEPEILNFRNLHNPQELLRRYDNLRKEPVIFAAKELPSIKIEPFITDDDIDLALSQGGNKSDSKFRIYSFFLQENTPKEKETFLKNEYSTSDSRTLTNGAYSMRLYYNSKGIEVVQGTSLEPINRAVIFWGRAARLINEQINTGCYMTRAELDRLQEYAKNVPDKTVDNSTHDIPLEILRPFPAGHPAVIGDDGKYIPYSHLSFADILEHSTAVQQQSVFGDQTSGRPEQITLFSLPTEDEQKAALAKAEEAQNNKSKATIDTVPIIEQTDIDEALRNWNGKSESKILVHLHMYDHAQSRARNAAQFLKDEYGGDLAAFTVTKDGTDSVMLPWTKVQKRVAQLVSTGQFLTPDEQAYVGKEYSEAIETLDTKNAKYATKVQPAIQDIDDNIRYLNSRVFITEFEKGEIVTVDSLIADADKVIQSNEPQNNRSIAGMVLGATLGQRIDPITYFNQNYARDYDFTQACMIRGYIQTAVEKDRMPLRSTPENERLPYPFPITSREWERVDLANKEDGAEKGLLLMRTRFAELMPVVIDDENGHELHEYQYKTNDATQYTAFVLAYSEQEAARMIPFDDYEIISADNVREPAAQATEKTEPEITTQDKQDSTTAESLNLSLKTQRKSYTQEETVKAIAAIDSDLLTVLTDYGFYNDVKKNEIASMFSHGILKHTAPDYFRKLEYYHKLHNVLRLSDGKPAAYCADNRGVFFTAAPNLSNSDFTLSQWNSHYTLPGARLFSWEEVTEALYTLCEHQMSGFTVTDNIQQQNSPEMNTPIEVQGIPITKAVIDSFSGHDRIIYKTDNNGDLYISNGFYLAKTQERDINVITDKINARRKKNKIEPVEGQRLLDHIENAGGNFELTQSPYEVEIGKFKACFYTDGKQYFQYNKSFLDIFNSGESRFFVEDNSSYDIHSHNLIVKDGNNGVLGLILPVTLHEKTRELLADVLPLEVEWKSELERIRETPTNDPYIGKEYFDGTDYHIISSIIKRDGEDYYLAPTIENGAISRSAGMIKPADMEQQIALWERTRVSKEEQRAAWEAKTAKDAADKLIYENTNGYTDNMPPMQKANALKVLNDPFHTKDYGRLNVKQFIEAAVNDGKTFEISKSLKKKYLDMDFLDYMRDYRGYEFDQISKRYRSILQNGEPEETPNALWLREKHPFLHYKIFHDKTVLDNSFLYTDYRLLTSENTFYNITKTAYEYGNYLISKAELEKQQAADVPIDTKRPYTIGDTVHLENGRRFAVNAINGNEITLIDTTLDVEMTRVMDIQDFEILLHDNPLNGHLFTVTADEPDNSPGYELSYKYVNDRLVVFNDINPDEINIVARVEPDGSIVIIDENLPEMERQKIQRIAETGLDKYKAEADARLQDMVDYAETAVNAENAAEANAEPDALPEPQYAVKKFANVAVISSNPQIYHNPKNPFSYGVIDTISNRCLKNEDESYVRFDTEIQAAAYAKKLNAKMKVALEAAKQTPDLLPDDVPITGVKQQNSATIFSNIPPVNFRVTGDNSSEGSAKAKYGYNVDAIRTLKQIEAESRRATPAEQEILSRYVGWGSLPQVFDSENKSWRREYAKLQELLEPGEYDMARASTLNTHNTPPIVIKAMYEAVERMGLKTDIILNPACAIGNFLGLVPDSMSTSKLYGVEPDSVSGRIAKQLYQKAEITISGYEVADRPDNFFDLAIGNVPFGSYKLKDSRYDEHNLSVNDYFFAKTLDQVRPGGIIAFITPKSTMDKQNTDVRKYIAQRAELLGAVRLPNTAFLETAGIEVTRDILFLQKRNRVLDIQPEWVDLSETDNEIPINSYFANNPQMILGTMEYIEGMYGSKIETTCNPIPGADLAEQLKTTLANITDELTAPELDSVKNKADKTIIADAAVKNFSYALVTLTEDGTAAEKVGEGEVYYRENSRMYPVELPEMTLERIRSMIVLRDCTQTLIDYQLNGNSDADIAEQQAELNRLYDDFSKKYGLINSQANSQAFSNDSAHYLLCSLELLDENGGLARKADMFTKRINVPVPTSDTITNLEVTPTALIIIANFVKTKLERGEKISSAELFVEAAKAYGDTMANNAFTSKDAYDAMELGVNQYILSLDNISPEKMLEMLDLLPSQTRRTADMEKFQQFSTPPSIAYLANWAANVNADDIMLEPSAGNGGIAVFAKKDGATVYVNELDKRRLEIIKNMPFDGFFNEDAEQINNIYGGRIEPTVIVMNPPFSSSAERNMQNGKIGAKHIEEALKILAPNGRLVAIAGQGMSDDAPAFRNWWRGIKEQYNVKANIGIDGKNYNKYGTNFGIQMIVIDKDGATIAPVKTAFVENLLDLQNMLGGIRNGRPSIQTEHDNGNEQKSDKSARLDAVTEREPERKQNDLVFDTGSRTDTGINGDRQEQVGASEFNTVLRGNSDTIPGLASISDNGSAPIINGERHRGNDGRNDDDNGVRRTGVADSGQSIGNVKPRVKKELTDSIFEQYEPQPLLLENVQPHPANISESAAMSAIELPPVTYKPNLSQAIIGKGILSDVQLEAVTYAGQSHSQTLPNGNTRGFFLGDGTGVGKGRTITGVILDNYVQGRKKALWLSENRGLIPDAKRDVKALFGDSDLVVEFVGGQKADKSLSMDEGILFATYSALSKSYDQSGSNFEKIVNWLGNDFDGVIVFDEAHNMANSIAMKGNRGVKKASQRGMAGLAIQEALPKAKIVYSSATGATEVENLRYAERLGLWGEGTAFPNGDDFVHKIKAGGLAAMELIARDMKAMGVYLSRNISYEDVVYDKIVHELTPEQRKIYDELARSWQIVLQNIKKALETTNQDKDGRAKGQAYSAFWGAEQRFFNQILTAMQVPSMITDIQQQLDNDNSIVIQLVSTNESAQEREFSRLQEQELDLDDFDLTPKQMLMSYIENSFPTVQFEEYKDDNGNVKSKPVYDSEGKAVINREAVRQKEMLLDKLGSIKVPASPLDMIINHFGSDMVAENTGRKRRVVVKDGKAKEENIAHKKQADVTAFQNGDKRIIIFSKAGGTGKSYHADKSAKNQQHRVHYLLQAGWQADAAVQGFGRSHRSNQVSAPTFALVTTDLKGQMRFISTIAKRLDQLGALTKGQRQTGSQGLFSAGDNLENTFAADVLAMYYKILIQNRVKGISDGVSIIEKLGLKDKLIDEYGGINTTAPELREVNKFLNRILSLECHEQNAVFDGYAERLHVATEQAMKNGTLDKGLENYRADKIVLKEAKDIRVDETTGATTKYYSLTAYDKIKPLQFDKVNTENPSFLGFFQNKTMYSVRAVFRTSSFTDEHGNISENCRLTGQNGNEYIPQDRLDNNWNKLTPERAEELWNDAVKELPEFETKNLHLIGGTVLPVWDKLPSENVRIYRVLTTDGELLIGRVIPEYLIDATLRQLGTSREKDELKTEDLLKGIKSGDTVYLDNGWRIMQKKVSSEQRIEVIGADFLHSDLLAKKGLFTERIGYQTRYFIPAVTNTIKILDEVIKISPVNRIENSREHAAENFKPSLTNPVRSNTAAQKMPPTSEKPSILAGVSSYKEMIKSDEKSKGSEGLKKEL